MVNERTELESAKVLLTIMVEEMKLETGHSIQPNLINTYYPKYNLTIEQAKQGMKYAFDQGWIEEATEYPKLTKSGYEAA